MDVPSDLPVAVIAQFLDLDLAILASPPLAYEEYARSIRQEYIHVPEQTYREARGRVLQGFLGRDKLFLGNGKEQEEARARLNLSTEIATLDSAGNVEFLPTSGDIDSV